MSQDRYALVGNPVAHSRSPQIHSAFASQTRQSMRYELMLAPIDPPGAFEAQVRAFFDGGGQGMNVTVPFKRRALALADVLTPRAQAAGALNTLARHDGGLIGDNTDGAGLVGDIIDRLGSAGGGLRAARVLLIGAGGAARGVVLPLLDAGAESITIANRTLANAQRIVDDLAPMLTPTETLPASDRLRAIGLTALSGLTGSTESPVVADIVINATSAGLVSAQGFVLAPAVFSACRLACDMVYGAQPSAFMRAARDAGAGSVADGLGMLVGQAAASFELWRGVRPDTAPVLASLRAELAGIEPQRRS